MFRKSFKIVFAIWALQYIYSVSTETQILQKCPDSMQTIYAVEENGAECQTFENICVFNREQVRRMENNENLLAIVSEEDCPNTCIAICTKDYNPICANVDGKNITFTNQCHLDNSLCVETIPINVLFSGECENQVPPNNCPESCNEEYSPLCVDVQGQNVTFFNQCQVDIRKCVEDISINVLHIGACETEPPKGNCPDCTDEYNPVCADVDGENITFTNECYMEYSQCVGKKPINKLFEGECVTKSPKANCPENCTDHYSPVCADVDGEKVTFTNQCYMKINKCDGKIPIQILFEGECEN